MSAILDEKVRELAIKYKNLAGSILKECVRIPADHQKEDPMCGTSNHEGPRLEYLKSVIIKEKCVNDPKDVFIDDFGNLVWYLKDDSDGIADADKKVVYFDGHSDTVYPLRENWHKVIGEGIDPFNGLTDKNQIDMGVLKKQLNWTLPEEELFEHAIFGRGTADQLAGVVSQVVSCKIMNELKEFGALKGVIIRSYATVCEEDNDGAGPMFIKTKVLPNAPAEMIPDVVVMTEGTGDSTNGSLGIYRGQRGRMQIEIEVIGHSCHGSMPWEGLNPLEYGGEILKEAAEQYQRKEGFKTHPFLGEGSRTASESWLETPSDCAVPARFRFRFDRRITIGENPKDCVASLDGLPAVKKARDAGLTVNVFIPIYEKPSHTGYRLNNEAVYLPWVTPEEHPCISAAVDAYKRVVTPNVAADHPNNEGYMRRDPRVAAWIFSTDGVGFPIEKDHPTIKVPDTKQWVHDEDFKYPPMFGIGAGLEQHCHKLGEYVDSRDVMHACAHLARFPSLFYESTRKN